MEPSLQPNEQNVEIEKIKLSDLPKEMLEEILIYLDKGCLLKASHVCKSFASAAESAFARKYTEEYYEISLTTKSFDKVMVNKYGDKMQRIIIDGNNNGLLNDEELLDLVEQKCCNVKFLEVTGSKIVMLKGIKDVYLECIENLEREAFTKFIHLNPKLQCLTLCNVKADLLNTLHGRLNNLKALSCLSFDGLFTPAIRLSSLESLRIEANDAAECIRMLQCIDCNQIKKLSLVNYDYNGDDGDAIDDAIDDAINEICKFEMLESLILPNYRITSDMMSKLAVHLPRLNTLDIEVTD